MITDPFAREVFDLEGIAEAISAFEDLLRRKEQEEREKKRKNEKAEKAEKSEEPEKLMPPGSSMESAGLTVLEMIDVFHRNLPSDPAQWHRKDWRQAIALADMLRKVLNVTWHPCFDRLWPHLLLLLGDGNISLNLWNPPSDADANKIFELYMALVLAPLSEHLEVDDPVRSSGGTNPDVIAELEGTRWAFSCKVMHSSLPKSFIDRVRDGIDQIERSDADQGIVVVSLKNLLPHDDFWGLQASSDLWDFLMPGPIEPEIAGRMFAGFGADYHQKVISEFPNGPVGFQNLFKGTKAVPVVLLHLCSTVSTSHQGRPSFHFIRMFSALTEDPIPSDVWAILEKLNLGLHNLVPPPLAVPLGA